MTNAEKYLKDNVSIEELIKQLYKIQDYNYNTNMRNCKKFFEEQVTPTLTEDERAILRHLKSFYYIWNVNGTLQLTNKEHTWCAYELYFDDDVFQFIKDGEEYSIEELLKGE